MNTVTSDNGKEFAKHESIAKNLDAQFFFAHPYASWERGLNENTNGLIRQYFPKKTQFNHISDQQVQSVMEKLNNRPRKCLGMKNTKPGILQGSFINRTSELNPRYLKTIELKRLICLT